MFNASAQSMWRCTFLIVQCVALATSGSRRGMQIGDDDECSTPPVLPVRLPYERSPWVVMPSGGQPTMTPSTTSITAKRARRVIQENSCAAMPNLMATAAPLNASHPPRAGDDDQCSTPQISHDYRPELRLLPVSVHSGIPCSLQLPMTPSTTRTTAAGGRGPSHVLKPVLKKLALTPAQPRRASVKKRLWSIFTGCLIVMTILCAQMLGVPYFRIPSSNQ